MKEKVLFVIGGLGKGGAEKHVKMLAKELSVKGRECAICCISEVDSRFVSENSGSFRVFSYGLKGGGGRSFCRKLILGLKIIIFMRKIYREFKPDIIHYFLPQAYVLGAISAIGFRSAQVMSRRSLNNYQKKNYILSMFERFFHHRMNMILVNSRAVYRQILSEGVSDTKVRLIYNGVENFDQDRKSSTLSRIRVKPQVVALCVANLIPYKGHMDLLRAFANVINEKNKNVTLLLVGRDDGIGAELNNFVKSNGLDQHVVFCGEVENVRDFCLESDLGVLVSHEEGFSNAVLECMAAGLPMIVSDVGGNAEAVDDKKTGLVVQPGEINDIASALETLIDDEGLRKKMGEKARIMAQEKFSIDACVDAYCKTYKEICQ